VEDHLAGQRNDLQRMKLEYDRFKSFAKSMDPSSPEYVSG